MNTFFCTISKVIFSLGVILMIYFPVSAQQENLDVFDRWIEWSDGKNMLIHHLNDQAFKLLDQRDYEIERLKSKDDWISRQKEVNDILQRIVGPFPEKTPLNAKVTGIVKKDGFRIEKVIYESLPGLYVTAAMFIPEGGSGTKPAVIQVSGHGFPAFRSAGTQRQLFNFVKKGFIVFAIDPLGQGERIQYWDDNKKGSAMGTSPTSEHSYFGNQMFLSGISPIRYFVWDGVRGVDYLLSRKEVDPGRIGIYGCSGGGTQTTFISAMDDRIQASVPGCYITGYRRLLESIGPQDAEQNVYHGILHGITHADMLELRAPKPLLVSSTTRDFFSIQGAIETFEEVKNAYRAFGMEENAGQVFDDAGHGFHGNITDIYAFFQDVFGIPGNPGELPFDGFSQGDLQVTGTGQLSTSIGGKLAFDINKAESEKLLSRINESRKDLGNHLEITEKDSRVLSGYVTPSEEVNSVFRGRYRREGYSVEMYALEGEGEYVIPLLLFVPANGTGLPGFIYLHPDGKIADASPGGKIEQLVKKGYIVAAPDVLGTGETSAGGNSSFYLSLMIGRSLPGIQAGDIARVVNFLKSRPDIDAGRISAVAFEQMGPSLLHVAVFNRSVNNITLIGNLLSYRSVVMNKYYDTGLTRNFVAGALTAYDLPDLAACLAPARLTIINPIEGNGKSVDAGSHEDLDIIKAAYNQKSVKSRLNIITGIDKNDSFKIFIDAL
jgi:dienelactone hydrolase